MGQLKTSRLTNDTTGEQVDNLIGELEVAISQILGVPIDTEIAAALFVVAANGLTKLILQDLAADPNGAGQLVRSGARLKFHNGAVQTLAHLADIAAGTNAYGARTISALPPSGTPNDGDVWDQI